jgi:hypothetical protein
MVAVALAACAWSAPTPALSSPSPSPVASQPEPSTAPRPFFLVPDSIDHTGATDAAPALQAFVDSVPNGSTILFANSGVYRLSSAIRLDGRHDLEFRGRGSTLSGTGCDVSQSMFLLGWTEPSSGITIRDLTLIGDNTEAGTPGAFRFDCQSQMGVAVYRSSDVEIANVRVSGVHGDCVYVDLGASAEPPWSSNVWFHDSECSLTGRMGVAVVAGRDVLVERVTFDGIGMFPFNIEPNYARGGAEHVRFVNNTVGTYTHTSHFTPYLFEANGSPDAPVDDVIVDGNVVINGTLSSKVQVPNRRDIVFTNNTSFVPAAGPVLVFDYVDGLTVLGNVQPLTSGSLADYGDSTCVVSQ